MAGRATGRTRRRPARRRRDGVRSAGWTRGLLVWVSLAGALVVAASLGLDLVSEAVVGHSLWRVCLAMGATSLVAAIGLASLRSRLAMATEDQAWRGRPGVGLLRRARGLADGVAGSLQAGAAPRRGEDGAKSGRRASGVRGVSPAGLGGPAGDVAPGTIARGSDLPRGPGLRHVDGCTGRRRGHRV